MTRFLLLPFALAVVAQPSNAQAQAPVDSAMVAAGQRLFEGRGLCATCHGKQGEGILGPTLRLNGEKKDWLHTDGSPAAIAALIKAGLDASVTKSGISMPPRGGARLTDAQVEQVTAYVLTLHSKKPTLK
jgi:mono/diheme cytochrome c family protein